MDANNGWTVGLSTILHTTNGGGSWLPQDSQTTDTLLGVTFVDANNGWAVAAAEAIRHTTNGGTTWAIQTSGTGYNLYTQNKNDPFFPGLRLIG